MKIKKRVISECGEYAYDVIEDNQVVDTFDTKAEARDFILTGEAHETMEWAAIGRIPGQAGESDPRPR